MVELVLRGLEQAWEKLLSSKNKYIKVSKKYYLDSCGICSYQWYMHDQEPHHTQCKREIQNYR